MDGAQAAAIVAAASCILNIISIVLVFMVLKTQKSSDNENTLKSDGAKKMLGELESRLVSRIDDGFSKSRIENSNEFVNLRSELSQRLGTMDEKLDRSAAQSMDFNIKSTQMISSSLTQIAQANDKRLEQIRQTVDEKLSDTLSKRLSASFSSVSQQLESVYKSLGEMKEMSGSVTQNVSSLNRVLSNVKARGTWAEVQLESILSQTIPTMYEKNFMPNPRSRMIVEFAVKIPSGDESGSVSYLPIDSKFPVEDYIRLCSAADNADKAGVEAARKALEARVLSQAREVSKYISEPVTVPFAIMYLATEGLYSEIISSKNAIAERCQREFNVMIAGPSTISALLSSLSVGFRAVAINEKAKQVRTLLAATKAQYEKFALVLEKAKKKIDEAGKTLDEAQSRNSIINKKLKDVEVLDSARASDIIGISDETLSAE